jgi:ribosomal protein L11 methyltransferase
VNNVDQDMLSGIFQISGCCGIHELDDNEWLVYYPGNWTQEHFQNLKSQIKAVNPYFDSKSLKINRIPFENWNEGWKKFFKPIQPVKGIWILPPWERKPGSEEQIEIIIDPQMAFGTGHHETTSLMIEAMNETLLTGKNILDVGTGSGLLAILAVRLGASNVVALDNDPESINNIRHNIQLNNVENINPILGEIGMVDNQKFDVILANINFEVLSNRAAKIVSLLKKSGRIILSGILIEETERIFTRFDECGLKVLKKFEKNEWAAIVLN